MAGTATPGSEGQGDALMPNFEELRETLQFDPFGPPSTDDAGGDDVGGQQGEGGETQTPAAEPPREQAAQPAAAEPPASDPSAAPEGGSENETLDSLRQLVSSFIVKDAGNRQEQPAAPQQQPQGQTQEQPRPQAPSYRFDLPDQIVDALESDDRTERKTALNAMLNGVANRLAVDFRAAMQETARALINHVPQQVSQVTTAERQQQMLREDLYGNFPELKAVAERLPDADGMIWRTVSLAAQRAGVTEWNPQFRDQVGNYLIASLGVQRQPRAGGQAQAAAPTAKPKPRAPFAAGSGSPPRNDVGTGGSGNEFLDVLQAGM